MGKEKIGIGELVGKVQKRPQPWAHCLIAPMVLKLLAQQTKENGIGKPLSIADIPLTADYHKVPDEILEKTTTMVVAALRQQAPGQDQQVKLDDKSIALVNLAAMHLLWDWLHTQGQEELAHNIQPYGTSILQPARLQSADYGIAQRNQIFHDIGNDREQLWIGHERKSSNRRGKLSKVDNIITLLRKESEGEEFEISSILEGDNIMIFDDQIIVFRDGVVSIYKKPDKTNLSEFSLLGEFPCDFESIENIKSQKIRYGWNVHQITGTKSIENKSEESSSITSTSNICINTIQPELSFITRNRQHLVNNYPIFIDYAGKKIIVLGPDYVDKIRFRNIGDRVDLGNGGQYIPFTTGRKEKRITFENGAIQIRNMK